MCCSLILRAYSQHSLAGTVTDAKTGDPLIGATIYIPDLKAGAVSDLNGHYLIQNLPAKEVLVQVTYIGYASRTQTIDLAVTSNYDFTLTQAITEINEVVITGMSQATEQKRTPTPISVVSHTMLLQNSSSNIIDALAKQPGVSEVTTGPAISKPEIRGLGYNRVVVVNDGVRQEGQQWGDEHGIEIDEFSVQKVEILKGPASLAYGSDAMAGVVNLISEPTISEGTVSGGILANYQTNNGLYAYSGSLEGNANGLIWELRFSQKYAYDYQNKYDGYVYGSNFTETAGSGMLGLNKKWGYSHLTLSYYHLTPGIVEGERDSATGQFVKPIALNDSTEGSVIADNNDFHTYTHTLPYQQIHHYKAVLSNSFLLGDGTLNLILGFQQNHRQEYDNALDPENYGLYFRLNTFTYDLQYLVPSTAGWHTTAGVNGMQQSSANLGSEFLVPAYDLFDFGVFVTTKKTMGSLDISGGIRYDVRNIMGDDLYLNSNGDPVMQPDSGSYHIFSSFHSVFSAISGSIGASYQFNDQMYGKLNISRGFRAPNIAEIGANGVHEGTFRYEIGDPGLKAETSLQGDVAFGYNGTHITFETDLFDNRISDFIYLRKLNSLFGGDSVINAEGSDVIAFKYVQGEANLYGAEVTLDIHPHPLDWLHFENSFSFVNAIQLGVADSEKYLPYSPAPKLISELRASFKNVGKSFANSYISVGMDSYFRQGHAFTAFNTETPTPGYILVEAGLGSDIVSGKKTLFSIYISAQNLGDVAYQSHLSRLKYAEENYATGRTGVYNMGRNISVKLLVPLQLKG